MRAFALVFTSLLVAAAWGGQPASAEMRLRAAYDGLLGPGAAKGAVVFNHGKELDKDTPDTPQPYVEAFRKAGWDIFSLSRPVAEDRVAASARELVAQAERLKAEGYRRIVSVGQSYGGWISYVAAGAKPGLFHAILATAPAAFGKRGSSWNWENNAQIATLAGSLHATRAMAFFFDKDEYDPGGRGLATRASLERRGIPHLVVDAPPGHVGHGGANTLGFAAEFGPCIVAFAEAADVAGGYRCPTRSFEEVRANFRLPPDIAVTVLASAPPAPPAHPLVGAWHGWYQNGREVLFVLDDPGNRDDVRAVYAWGRYKNVDEGGWERIAGGKLAGGNLSFAGTKARLTYILREDGRLDARWEKAGGGSALTAVLSRVEPSTRLPVAMSLSAGKDAQASPAAGAKQ